MKQQFKIEQNENAQILIVDDNIFNLNSLQQMIFIKFTIESKIFSSGKMAIEHIEQKINQKKMHIKIIFMDCSMPDMDGFETSKYIMDLCRKHNIEMPYIIALTAYSKEN